MMWPKSEYQEQMLGYLGEVQTEIERFTPTRLQRHDLNRLYRDLDLATERLWRLIAASDVNWEAFRYTLEASCDELLYAYYRVQHAHSVLRSSNITGDDYPAIDHDPQLTFRDIILAV